MEKNTLPGETCGFCIGYWLEARTSALTAFKNDIHKNTAVVFCIPVQSLLTWSCTNGLNSEGAQVVDQPSDRYGSSDPKCVPLPLWQTLCPAAWEQRCRGVKKTSLQDILYTVNTNSGAQKSFTTNWNLKDHWEDLKCCQHQRRTEWALHEVSNGHVWQESFQVPQRPPLWLVDAVEQEWQSEMLLSPVCGLPVATGGTL